jgi:hypothetical protein
MVRKRKKRTSRLINSVFFICDLLCLIFISCIARIVPVLFPLSPLLVAIKRGHLLISVLESDRSRFEESISKTEMKGKHWRRLSWPWKGFPL